MQSTLNVYRFSALEEVGVETRGGYYEPQRGHEGYGAESLVSDPLYCGYGTAGELMLAGEEMHREQIRVLSALHTPEKIEESLVWVNIKVIGRKCGGRGLYDGKLRSFESFSGQ